MITAATPPPMTVGESMLPMMILTKRQEVATKVNSASRQQQQRPSTNNIQRQISVESYAHPLP